jgi:hypothetical protein
MQASRAARLAGSNNVAAAAVAWSKRAKRHLTIKLLIIFC